MLLIEDEGQKVGKHILKNNYWHKNSVEVARLPLPVGDYILCNEKVRDVIERKKERGINVKKWTSWELTMFQLIQKKICRRL